MYSPPLKNHPLKAHRFYVVPPLKNHPSKPIGFVYSPLWKITHQSPSVLCTPPFEKSSIKAHRFCVVFRWSERSKCITIITPSPSGSFWRASAAPSWFYCCLRWSFGGWDSTNVNAVTTKFPSTRSSRWCRWWMTTTRRTIRVDFWWIATSKRPVSARLPPVPTRKSTRLSTNLPSERNYKEF